MSTTKKIISMIVMVALVMTMATVALVSTSAAAKVYFEDSLSWGNIHAYCFGGDGELLGSWPGQPCKDEGNGIWSIELSGAPQAVIFHANDDTNQTSNINFAGDSMIAKLTGEWIQGDYKMVAVAEFSAYAQTPDAPVATGDVATPDVPTTAPTTEATVPTTEATVPTTEATQPTNPAETGINVNGTIYDVPVGTTVTYTATVTADKLFEDVQAYVAYDSTVLELVRITSEDPDLADWEVEGPVRCPNLENVLFNGGIDGVVKFNASDVAGFDFKDGKVLVTLEFVVKDTAYSAIELVVDEMTIKGGAESYFTDGAASVTEGIAIVETLTFEEEKETTPDESQPITTEPITTEPITTEPITTEPITTEPGTTAGTVPAPSTGDATGTEEVPTTGEADLPPTGAATYIYVAMAMMAMAACAVVVLRKKVNG